MMNILNILNILNIRKKFDILKIKYILYVFKFSNEYI